MAEQPDKPAVPAASPAEIAAGLLPHNLGVKVGMLIAFTVMVIGGFIIYVLFARGVFEATQRLTLVTDNAEGVTLGMDLTFSGFPIGRVRRITLREDGKVRIDIDVPRKDAHWLRTSSLKDIENQVFKNEKNESVAPPPTLLYNLLRHAVLQSFWDTAMKIYEDFKIVNWDARREYQVANVKLKTATNTVANVAVAQHGNRCDVLLQRRNGFPVGYAVVELRCGAAVQCNRCTAGLFADPPCLEVRQQVVVDALAELHCDRPTTGCTNRRLDNRCKQAGP